MKGKKGTRVRIPRYHLRMKLLELEPRFVRYETRPDGRYQVEVPLADAQGVVFLCPGCWTRNGGPIGTHAIMVTFVGRGAADDEGSHNSKGKPSRWKVSGTGVEDLTLEPSINVTDDWHGFVRKGVIETC